RVKDVGPKFLATMKAQPWLWTLIVMGRLNPGASFEQARSDLQSVFQAAATEGWHASPRFQASRPADTPRLEIEPGSKGLTDSRRSLARAVWIMTAVVSPVLLIVCANLANLLPARAAARQKEMALGMA